MKLRTKLSVGNPARLRKRKAFFICILLGIYSELGGEERVSLKDLIFIVMLLMSLFDMLNFPC